MAPQSRINQKKTSQQQLIITSIVIKGMFELIPMLVNDHGKGGVMTFFHVHESRKLANEACTWTEGTFPKSRY